MHKWTRFPFAMSNVWCRCNNISCVTLCALFYFIYYFNDCDSELCKILALNSRCNSQLLKLCVCVHVQLNAKVLQLHTFKFDLKPLLFVTNKEQIRRFVLLAISWRSAIRLHLILLSLVFCFVLFFLLHCIALHCNFDIGFICWISNEGNDNERTFNGSSMKMEQIFINKAFFVTKFSRLNVVCVVNCKNEQKPWSTLNLI